MRAYHNDPAIKQKYLDRVAAHRAADELVKGVGWEHGKGCAIGCTLEAYDHSRYPVELGIPEMLARLEDTIFEGLPNDRSQEWPEQFLSAIEPGANLSLVGWKFLYWLLTESKIGAYDHELVRDAVQQCAAVLEPLTRGEKADWSAALNAAGAARSAASAESAAWIVAHAAHAARSAARSAARIVAHAARSAESAESAARIAESAARIAESAARSAASAAWIAASAAWSAAWSAAASGAYEKMADKLIDLLKEVE